MVSLRKRKLIAVTLIVGYLFTTAWVFVVAYDLPVWPLNTPAKEESFQITASLYLRSGPTLPIQTPDISLALNVYYTGRIVVNQSVRIQAIAELISPDAKNLTQMGITFPNALAWPPVKNRYGILNGTGITLLHNSTELMGGTAFFFWAVAGTYNPIIFAVDTDGMTDIFANNPALVIQVLPYENLAELQANKVNEVLAWALFVLTALGVANGVIDLLEPPK